MVALAEIERTLYRERGGMSGDAGPRAGEGSDGEGVGKEAAAGVKARIRVKYANSGVSSMGSGRQSSELDLSTQASSYSRNDEVRLKRSAQTEQATVRMAMEF